VRGRKILSEPSSDKKAGELSLDLEEKEDFRNSEQPSSNHIVANKRAALTGSCIRPTRAASPLTLS